MLYIYTILPVFIILTITYILSKIKPKKFHEHVVLWFNALPYLFGYGVVLHIMVISQLINEGWASYSYMFFLIPLALLIVILKIFMPNKNKN